VILPPGVFRRMKRRLEAAERRFESRPVYEMLEKMKDIHSESQWDAVCPEVLAWLEEEKGEYRSI